jgi:hypothetical protein
MPKELRFNFDQVAEWVLAKDAAMEREIAYYTLQSAQNAPERTEAMREYLEATNEVRAREGTF